MRVIVHSKNPLSSREKSWVTGIVAESECPNESFAKTFGDRFHHIFQDSTDEIEVFLDSPDAEYKWRVEVERVL